MRKEVKSVSYTIHRKIGSPDSMRVSYFCTDGDIVMEWVCPAHSGFAGERARKWITERLTESFSFDNISELIVYSQKNFKAPNFIEFIFDGKFHKIFKLDFITPRTVPDKKYSYAENFYNKNKKHFDIMGISSHIFTIEDLKKNFRKLSFKHHPDHGGSPEKFILLQDARELLQYFIEKN